jgi:hypothetical protein
MLTTMVAAAQDSETPAEKLMSAKTLTCTFPVVATGTWKDGVPQATTHPATRTFRFENIDVDEGTASLAGSAGDFHLIVQRMSDTLHFMQSFASGALYMTTVFPSENADGKLKAVHSRHEYVEVALPGFTSQPEQYYGECEADPPSS